jgi:GT2 family glycosyltransferase
VKAPVVVAIPTRNRPAAVAEAVASVLAQTDPDWIAVVADDGEEPPALPADPRVEVVRAFGRSPGSARNAAIRRGLERIGDPADALVALLDDDDRWDPDHLATMRAALDADPAALFAHGAARTRDGERETPYHFRGGLPLPRDLFLRMLEHDVVATSTALLRADAWRAVGGFREDLSHGEDWGFFLALSRAGPAAFVERPTVTYVRHGGNVSGESVRKLAPQFQALLPLWRRRHLLSPAHRRTLHRTLSRLARRRVRLLLSQTDVPRAQVRREAAAMRREVPGLRTTVAWLRAALPGLAPRGSRPAPDPADR